MDDDELLREVDVVRLIGVSDGSIVDADDAGELIDVGGGIGLRRSAAAEAADVAIGFKARRVRNDVVRIKRLVIGERGIRGDIASCEPVTRGGSALTISGEDSASEIVNGLGDE